MHFIIFTIFLLFLSLPSQAVDIKSDQAIVIDFDTNEVLSDPSKQMKIVIQSMNEATFNNTIDSAPVESVSISNLDSNIKEIKNNNYINQSIEIGLSEIKNKKLYLKIYGFTSYDNAKTIITDLKLQYKFSSHNEGSNYSVIMGPLENLEANNLVLSFISKGYKKTEFILE